MILSEFDSSKKAVINPSDFVEKDDNFPKTIISFFHHDLIDEFVKVFRPKIIKKINSCTKDFEIYQIKYKGLELGVVQSPMGAPYCVSIFEELVANGMENMLLVGSCGCLDSEIEDYSIVIPTASIRDEGTSYHYQPEGDIIKIKELCVSIVENTLKNLRIKYSKGINWTTDAIYRETPKKVKRRKSQGAITVDMECSAMTAAAKFRGVNFAQIFYAADDLSKEQYDIRSLINGNLSKQAQIIPIALEIGFNLDQCFSGSKLIEKYI